MIPAPDPTEASNLPDPKVQRLLVFVVVFLGLLIVAGLVAVLGRVIYLSSLAVPKAEAPTVGSASPGPAALQGAGLERTIAEFPLALPPGAEVKSTSLSGNRLAVHYNAADGAAIVIVDLEAKSIIARVKIGH